MYSVLWTCVISTEYCTLPVQQSLIKSTANEKSTFSLFNCVSYVVVAWTVPKIGVLKDRPFIPECKLESECSCYRPFLQLTEDGVP